MTVSLSCATVHAGRIFSILYSGAVFDVSFIINDHVHVGSESCSDGSRVLENGEEEKSWIFGNWWLSVVVA